MLLKPKPFSIKQSYGVGSIRWRKQLDSPIRSLHASSRGDTISVATLGLLNNFDIKGTNNYPRKVRIETPMEATFSSENSSTCLATYEGLECYTKTGDKKGDTIDLRDVLCQTVSSSGNYILVGTSHGVTCLSRNKNRLFSIDSPRPVRVVTISENDESFIFTADTHIFCLDKNGDQRWHHQLDTPTICVDVSRNGELTAVGTSKRLIVFDATGRILWRYTTGNCQKVKVSGNGETVVGVASTHITCLDARGNPRWTYETRDFVNDLALSDGGECIVVGTGTDIFRDYTFYCFHRSDSILYKIEFPKPILHVSSSAAGDTIAIGSERSLYLLDNTAVVRKMVELKIKQIRDQVKNFEEYGLDTRQIVKLVERSSDNLDKTSLSDAMGSVRDAQRICDHLQKRYAEAHKEVPRWVERLGIDVKDFSKKFIQLIFPIYSVYQDLVEDGTTTTAREEIEGTITRFSKDLETLESLRESFVAQDVRKTFDNRSQEMVDTTNEALGRLKKDLELLEFLDAERRNHIREVEDHARIIILDWITKRTDTLSTREFLDLIEKKKRDLGERVREVLKHTQLVVDIATTSFETPGSQKLQVKMGLSALGADVRGSLVLRNLSDNDYTRLKIRILVDSDTIELDRRHIEKADITLAGKSDRVEDLSFNIPDTALSEDPMKNGIIVKGFVSFEDTEGDPHLIKLPEKRRHLIRHTLIPHTVQVSEMQDAFSEGIGSSKTAIIHDANLEKVEDTFKKISEPGTSVFPGGKIHEADQYVGYFASHAYQSIHYGESYVVAMGASGSSEGGEGNLKVVIWVTCVDCQPGSSHRELELVEELFDSLDYHLHISKKDGFGWAEPEEIKAIPFLKTLMERLETMRAPKEEMPSEPTFSVLLADTASEAMEDLDALLKEDPSALFMLNADVDAEYFRQNLGSQSYDLAIVGTGIQGGDALELIEEVSASNPKAALILVVDDRDDKEVEEKIEMLGIVKVMERPWEPSEMALHIREILVPEIGGSDEPPADGSDEKEKGNVSADS